MRRGPTTTPVVALLVVVQMVVGGCGTGPPTAVPSTAPASPSSAAASTQSPSASAPSPRPSPSAAARWLVVAVGDSVPFNSPADCPGCISLVDRYAEHLSEASGETVNVRNLSKHTGLRVQGLLDDLESYNEQQLASIADGDVLIVSIGGNDLPWNALDDPCDGATSWDTAEIARAAMAKYTNECVTASIDLYRPRFEAVYSHLADLRAGRPTILLTMNRYNDWIGWCELRTCEWNTKTTPTDMLDVMHGVYDAWNEMTCKAARDNGFTCVDVYHSFNGPDGTDPAGDLLALDYVHPSQLGNDRIASLLADAGFAPLVP